MLRNIKVFSITAIGAMGFSIALLGLTNLMAGI